MVQLHLIGFNFLFRLKEEISLLLKIHPLFDIELHHVSETVSDQRTQRFQIVKEHLVTQVLLLIGVVAIFDGKILRPKLVKS